MLKQRRYYQLKPFFIKNFKKNYSTNLLIKSLQQNDKQKPEKRLELFQTNFILKSEKRFFISYSKLRCNLTYSKSVPSKHLLMSRYALNKHMNSLTLGFFSKSYK